MKIFNLRLCGVKVLVAIIEIAYNQNLLKTMNVIKYNNDINS